MSVEAPERIWAASVTDSYGEWQTVKDGLPRPVEYVRADKLEELAAENEGLQRRLELTQDTDSKMKLLLDQEDQIIRHEAALAEKDKEIAALSDERDFLQEILDTRPAINAALPESYIRWSQSLYSGEAVRAWLSARNAGGKDANE